MADEQEKSADRSSSDHLESTPFATDEESERIASSSDMNLQLAMTRTALSLDRTLLSWIRTSLALIGFGFTLAKYIHVLVTHDALRSLKIDSPRTIGIIMMLLGVGGIAGGIVQYLNSMSHLKRVGVVSQWTPALVMAIMLLVAGGALTWRIVAKAHMF